MVKYDQDNYLKAYEELSKTGINVNALIMLTEMTNRAKTIDKK